MVGILFRCTEKYGATYFLEKISEHSKQMKLKKKEAIAIKA